MQYGIEVVPFGDFADPRPMVQLAQAAEAAGWEALWLWDHVVFPYGAGDPWVTLAAIAAAPSASSSARALRRCPAIARICWPAPSLRWTG